MTRKAYLIGAGIGSLSAAVYLIRDGHWDGSQITILGLEDHGANDGNRVAAYETEYGHKALSNKAGFLKRNDQILWMVSGVVGVRNAPSRG